MIQNTLMQHQMEKFGVVTVMDALLRDPETKQPLLYMDTLKITSINQEGESKEIRGGIGAPKLIEYDFGLTVSLEIQDALASIASLRLLWGGEAAEGDIDYTAKFDAYPKLEGSDYIIEIPENIKITGEQLDSSIVMDSKNGAAYKIKEVDTTENTLTLETVSGNTPDTKSEMKVFIEATVKAGVNGASALSVMGNSLPPTVTLEGSTFFINQATGKQVPVSIEVPLLKIKIGGGLSMEAEGDAAVFDFNGEALLDPVTKEYFVIKTIGNQE